MMFYWIFFQSSIYSLGKTSFCNNKIILLLSWFRKFECILKSVSLTFHQTFLIIIVQHKEWHSTKSSLKFIYSRKQSQYLYLIPQVSHFYHPVCIDIQFYEFLQRDYWQDLIKSLSQTFCYQWIVICKIYFCNLFFIFINSRNFFFY